MGDPYVMGYDIQPLETVEEKREMLYHADREDWVLFFEHDPQQAFARVDLSGEKRRAVPVAAEDVPAVIEP